MAKRFGENREVDFAATKLMSFGKSFSRMNGQPLDESEVWYDLGALQTFAASDSAYVGMKVVYVDTTKNKVYQYSIELDGSLKELGSSPVGDEKSITVAEDGTVSLYGIAGLALTREVEKDGETVVEKINYQPLLVDGKLTWVEPSATTVEGLATEIEGIKTRLGALETTVGKAAEGENEATGLVKAVAEIEAKIGVAASEGVEATGLEKKIADNTTAIDGKVDKVEGKGLSTNDLTDDLKANYDDSYEHSQAAHAPADAQANVIEKIKVNGAEQTITDKAVDIAVPKKVSELENDNGYLTAVPDEYVTEDELIAKGYQTASDVEGIVDAAIAEINHAVFQKVDTVPAVADAETNVLYLVPNDGKMDIYAKIGEEMVLIDDTDADLSGYAKTEDLHEHANKALLDTYDQTNDDIKDAITKKHEHSFADSDVDDVIAKKHEHKNLDLLETYTQTEEDLADAVAKKHEHGNATVLDAITAEKVAAWGEAEKNVIVSVDEDQFAIDGDRKLTLLDVAQDKISGLTNAAGNDITLVEALAGKVDKKSSEVTVKDAEGNETTETVEWTLLSPENQNKLAALVIDKDGQVGVSGTISAENVTGLDALLNEKVDKVEGMGLSANNFTDTLLEKLNGINAGAQVNVLEAIKINGVAQTITDKAVNIPVATDTLLGVVMGSDAENKISVAEDGTMEINSVNVNKLVQTDGEYLIMNGGSASM